MSNGKTRIACKYFVSGACSKGANCPFLHDRSAPVDNNCRYFLAGSCVYGQRCRYDHVRPAPKVSSSVKSSKADEASSSSQVKPKPIISSKPTINSALRVDAPEFVPSSSKTIEAEPSEVFSYAGAVSGKDFEKLPDTAKDKICPYNIMGECYFGENCPFTHGASCDLCGKPVVHPWREELNAEHRRECLAFHEAEMEAAFAAAASQGKACGICMDVVLEKSEKGQRRFGILTNCRHCFCLRCIRQWRGQGQPEDELQPGGMDKRTVRRCPECRVSSEFVVPSSVWVEDVDCKAALVDAYRERMRKIPCKYYKTAGTECPFGNKCHYRHERPDGTLDPGEDPAVIQRRMRARRERGGGTLLADFLALRALVDLMGEEEYPEWLDDDSEDEMIGRMEEEEESLSPTNPPPPQMDEEAAEAWLIAQLQEDFANLQFFSINDPPGNQADDSWPAP